MSLGYWTRRGGHGVKANQGARAQRTGPLRALPEQQVPGSRGSCCGPRTASATSGCAPPMGLVICLTDEDARVGVSVGSGSSLVFSVITRTSIPTRFFIAQSVLAVYPLPSLPQQVTVYQTQSSISVLSQRQSVSLVHYFKCIVTLQWVL